MSCHQSWQMTAPSLIVCNLNFSHQKSNFGVSAERFTNKVKWSRSSSWMRWSCPQMSTFCPFYFQTVLSKYFFRYMRHWDILKLGCHIYVGLSAVQTSEQCQQTEAETTSEGVQIPRAGQGWPHSNTPTWSLSQRESETAVTRDAQWWWRWGWRYNAKSLSAWFRQRIRWRQRD